MVLGRFQKGDCVSAGRDPLQGGAGGRDIQMKSRGDKAAAGLPHFPGACMPWTLTRFGWMDREAGSGLVWQNPKAGIASVGVVIRG